MNGHDEGGTLPIGFSTVENTTGQDLVIHAPCATASASAPMNEEAGDALD